MASVQSPKSRLLGYVHRVISAYLTRAGIDFDGAYAGVVQSQNSDGPAINPSAGTLQVKPLNTKRFGTGWNKVQMLPGVPGVTAQVAPGTQVWVQFSDRSGGNPYVVAFGQGSVIKLNVTATSIVLGDGILPALPVARKGDSVQVNVPGVMLGPSTATGTGVIIQGSTIVSSG